VEMGCLQSCPDSPLHPGTPEEDIDYCHASNSHHPCESYCTAAGNPDVSDTENDNPEYAENIFELVIKITKELELLLVCNYAATGKGLHEKLNSVEGQLSVGIVKQIRYLATFRNKVVHHEYTPTESDRTAFTLAYEQVKNKMDIRRIAVGNSTLPNSTAITRSRRNKRGRR